MRVMKWSIIALAVAAGTSQLAVASSQDESKGFIEDSKLSVKTRAMYMNRDFRNGAGNVPDATKSSGFKNGYREDSGISMLGIYESGFTQGTVGFGVDAMAMGTARFDGGEGRAGNGLFRTDSDGKPEDAQGKTGGAVKLRVSDTVLKYGRQFVASPVFATDDSRLLPEVAEGTLITSDEIKGLQLSAGRFTALSSQTGMGKDSINGKHTPGLTSANIAGATYSFTDNFVGTLAASDVDDYFKKQYINLNYTLPIDDSQSLNFDFNAYRTKDQGQALYGELDNKLWSLAAAYSLGAHKFTLAYQRSTGDSAYLYGVDGNGTIFVSNSIQISDFIGEEEKSWQARYDLNMASYGVPGLSFMARYVHGDNIETTSNTEGKENEFNFETKYVIQEGAAKDLSFRVRHAIYRANDAYNADYTADNNDFRLIVEYPLSIL
ncbi:OprD family porin [Pseudomonas rubra]|uniref:OprD family porin n=1 Tax=Pseudomonas rubra TaxID=2942627 RepID=A0ABT5P8U4_9PSED|nr:OprD family porin [Pseudomonas rubra]MDD1014730.1 OprD family porin [Pseudomonas rubra]MDD1040821.1 OprD family porin [Pseudomonas rubra]MDD1157649.1 OprD family porin [Pseudomonas rubra]